MITTIQSLTNQELGTLPNTVCLYLFNESLEQSMRWGLIIIPISQLRHRTRASVTCPNSHMRLVRSKVNGLKHYMSRTYVVFFCSLEHEKVYSSSYIHNFMFIHIQPSPKGASFNCEFATYAKNTHPARVGGDVMTGKKCNSQNTKITFSIDLTHFLCTFFQQLFRKRQWSHRKKCGSCSILT